MNVSTTKFNFKFSGSSVIKGLKDIESKLNNNIKKSKDTDKAMTAMRESSHALRNSMALIGVGSFTALILTAPKLAGSLAKIKIEAQLIAWSIGKHLKPVLDAVGLILHGIRTGEWKEIKQGISDMFSGLKTVFTAGYNWIKKNIFGTFINYVKTDLKDKIIDTFSDIAHKIYDHLPSWLQNFVDWVGRIAKSVEDRDWKKLWYTVLHEPFMWVWRNVISKLPFAGVVSNIVVAIWEQREKIKTLFETLVNWAKVGAIIGTDVISGFYKWIDNKKSSMSNTFWNAIDTILGRKVKPLPEFEGTSTTADDTFNKEISKNMKETSYNIEEIIYSGYKMNSNYNDIDSDLNLINDNLSFIDIKAAYLSRLNDVERSNYDKLIDINNSIGNMSTSTNDLKSYIESNKNADSGGGGGGGGGGGDGGDGGGGGSDTNPDEDEEEKYLWYKDYDAPSADNSFLRNYPSIVGGTPIKENLLFSWIGELYTGVSNWMAEYNTAKDNQDPRLLWFYTGSESDETQRLYFATEAGADQISNVNPNMLIPSAWIAMNTPFAQPYYQTGGMIPYDGYFNLHAGERIINKGQNTDNKLNNINIDVNFDGANISLDTGDNINELAENVSRLIANNTITMTY